MKLPWNLWVAACAGVVLAGGGAGAALLGGCSSTDNTAGGSDASVDGDGASTTDGSGDGAGDAGDAGKDSGGGDGGGCTLPQNGKPSDPGSIDCAGGPCATGTNVCCERADGGACLNAAQQCMGMTFECNETADCPKGEECCLEIGAMGGVQVTCAQSCTQTQHKICRCLDECGDAGACTPQTCQGYAVEACGPIPGCQ